MSKKTNAYAATLRLLCFGAAAVCSVLIFRDIPSGVVEASLAPSEPTVADVAWVHGQVWCKRAEFERPEPLVSKRGIGEGAILGTEERGGARLHLSGMRGTVSIGDNSSAQISSNAVTLLSGSVGLSAQSGD